MANLRKIITKDGSQTFYNEDIGEAYHSTSGALQEALEKHFLPSKLTEHAQEFNHVVIADICFGLGYNTFVSLVNIRQQFPIKPITIYAFENDVNILSQIKNIAFPAEYNWVLKLFSTLLQQSPIQQNDAMHYRLTQENITFNLYVGDARQTIAYAPNESFDAVFFDPFSPQKQPELWSQNFFTIVKQKMKASALLTTYSCARMVRTNLQAVGFHVQDGPRVGRRSPSTIAIKNA